MCLLSYPFVPFLFVPFHSAVVLLWKLRRVFLVLCNFFSFQLFAVLVSVSFLPTKVSKATVACLGTDVSAGLGVNLWVRGVWTHLTGRCQGLPVQSSIPSGSQSPSAPSTSKKSEVENPQKQFKHCSLGTVLSSCSHLNEWTKIKWMNAEERSALLWGDGNTPPSFYSQGKSFLPSLTNNYISTCISSSWAMPVHLWQNCSYKASVYF